MEDLRRLLSRRPSPSQLQDTVSLVWGDPPAWRANERITICTMDGCMAERLTPRHTGTIVRATSIPCANGPAMAGLVIACDDGKERTEMVSRLRRRDGHLLIANP